MSKTKCKSADGKVNHARREALAKMGRFAAYTAPSVLTLLVADRAVANSGGGSTGRRRSGRSLGGFLRRLLANLGGRGFG